MAHFTYLICFVVVIEASGAGAGKIAKLPIDITESYRELVESDLRVSRCLASRKRAKTTYLTYKECNEVITTWYHRKRSTFGGLFNDETLELSLVAFNNTCDAGDGGQHYGKIFYPNVIDSFSTSLQMCTNTTEGSVVALIDARPTKGVCDYTCALCNRLNISHLSLGWQPTDTHAEDLYTFSYYPPPEVISKAFTTYIKYLAWDKVTMFYEDEGSFIRLQEVINTWRDEFDPIVYRKLNPNIDNRETFKEVIKKLRINTHILDCELEHIPMYVDQIMSVENSTQYQSFLLTNLDSHLYTLHNKDFKANVSTMHMTFKNDAKWQDARIHPSLPIKMETALTADALSHLRKAITALSANSNPEDETVNQLFEDPPSICFAEKVSDYSEKAWPHGNGLREALLSTSIPEGFTGNVEFDKNGRRTNVRLHYSKLTNTSEFAVTGYWDSTKDSITKEDETVKDLSLTLQKEVLTVATKGDPPYAYYTKWENGTTSDLRGYAVDLIYEIFKYIEKNNGTKFVPKFRVTTGIDAIMGDIMNYNADLGICDLTINSDRNKVVDFSIPFMATGIALMARVPDPEEPNMFSFVNPLTLDVWLYLATTYIIVSVVLLICARMSQDDWVNPHPCNQNPENLQNIWSLYNCMWLTMGTIMTQGCDILPRGIGSRWITGMWWFFAMIVTASYTANMASVISASRRNDEIQDPKDLADQNTISYGAAINSSTYNFFKISNDSLHKKLWAAMESAKPTVFEENNEKGKERVLNGKGKYAFFLESTAIKYFVERNKNLRMVGSELDSKEYGIAMPKNSPVKGLVDSALLTLQENGFMSELRIKWWKKEDNPNYNEGEEELTETKNDGSVKMEKTSGIFIVLGVGVVLGLIVAVINFLMHAHEISVEEKVTYKEAIVSEWRASLNPRLLQKPVAPPRSTPPSPSSPQRERSRSRAVSVLKAATSFINFDDIY